MEVVRPALAAGRFVLCDRFVASTLVFQTLNREGGATVDDATVIEMHRLVCDDQAPDLTLHVHAPADVRLARRNARAEGHDRFDNGDASFDAAVAAKYASAGRVLGHPTIDVDGSGTPDDTVDAMMVAVAPLLPAGS